MRQTNIIWMLFVACTGVIDCSLAHRKDDVRLADLNASDQKEGQISRLTSDKGGINGSTLRKRRFGNAVDTVEHSIPRSSSTFSPCSSGLFNEIQVILFTSWQLKWELFVSFSPFFIVLVAFVAFVRWNGSIVLGAKEAHAVSLHFTQILYFSLVSALFMAPVHFTLSRASTVVCSFWENRSFSFFQWIIAFIAGFLSVRFFSIAHPYLLADNRHYPFYLWRKIINAHWSTKYLLVPLYVYSWFTISNILAKSQRKIWVLVYFLATAATLVPAPLIEFRYYTIPFFFLIIHSRVDDKKSWLLMGIIFVVVNIFTMVMFLFRPFHWAHEHGIQRFIW